MQIKKRAAYSLQRGPEGNGHRRLGRGGFAGWPDHQQGDVCRLANRLLKATACVSVLTKPRLSSFSTMWNFAARAGRKRRSSHLSHQERGGEVRANCGRRQFDARGDLRMPTGRYRRLGPVATFRATSQAGGTTPRVASWTWEHVATRRAAG